MPALAYRTSSPHPAPVDPGPLALARTPGPSPDALGPSSEACEVIELFPGSGPGIGRTWGSAPHGEAGSALEMAKRDAGTGAQPTRPDRGRRVRGERRGGLRAARRRAALRFRLLRRWTAGRAAGQQGMATAEYAIATLGAVAFAGLLVVIMRSDEVRGFLLGIIRAALALP